MVKRVRRYDAGDLRSPVKLPNGWLRADACFTRTGVFHYRNADGTVRREYRPDEEVFKKDALDSFALAPFTDDHPSVPLDSKNTAAYVKGAIEAPRRDGSNVVGSILVYDGATIEKMAAGKTQLSCGYDCDLEHTAGEWNGQRYDAIQRNIRGNHVALVDRGRAGPGASVKMDAADAFQVDGQEPQPGDKPATEKGSTMNRKIKIDGVTFEIAEAAADAFEKFEREAKTRADALSTELAAVKKSAETEKARADVASEALTASKKAHADAIDPKRVDAIVEARATLLSTAREHVGADFKMDGKTDRAVKVEILAKLDSAFKADGRSDDYVNARFDLAIEKARTDGGALANANRAANGNPEKRVDSKGAPDNRTEKERRDAMTEDLRNRWKNPTIGAFSEDRTDAE